MPGVDDGSFQQRHSAPTCVALQVPYNGISTRLKIDVTDYTPIDCSEYDWLEIACMDGYLVRLDLGDRAVTGVASTLNARAGAEYLLVSSTSGAAEHVRVDQIRSITVLTRPARFTYHAFSVAAE